MAQEVEFSEKGFKRRPNLNDYVEFQRYIPEFISAFAEKDTLLPCQASLKLRPAIASI